MQRYLSSQEEALDQPQPSSWLTVTTAPSFQNYWLKAKLFPPGPVTGHLKALWTGEFSGQRKMLGFDFLTLMFVQNHIYLMRK